MKNYILFHSLSQGTSQKYYITNNTKPCVCTSYYLEINLKTVKCETNFSCICNLISHEDTLECSCGHLGESPVAPCATLALCALYLLLFASLTGTRVHTDAAACTVGFIKIATEADRH
jgi:hypothetical protein